MTMDNGEGRPLDEEEAGSEDPQGWYFDLPGGAWERQEEKNRSLRERVLGNIEEDAEKTKGDPFAKKFEVQPQGPTFELRKREPETKKPAMSRMAPERSRLAPSSRTTATTSGPPSRL
jgi:hypothetical protein